MPFDLEGQAHTILYAVPRLGADLKDRSRPHRQFVSADLVSPDLIEKIGESLEQSLLPIKASGQPGCGDSP